MNFLKQKRSFLQKKDKSKKASIDKEIKDLVDLINSKKNYYTTSSCAGRIVLLTKRANKKGARWLFVSHKPIKYNQIKKALVKLPKTDIWFRMEPVILHVACSTINSAQNLLDKARAVGFKRGGIISTKRKIIIEIQGTEFLDTLIAKNSKLIVTEHYLKTIINEANKKLRITRKKLKKFKLLVSTL